MNEVKSKLGAAEALVRSWVWDGFLALFSLFKRNLRTIAGSFLLGQQSSEKNHTLQTVLENWKMNTPLRVP